MAQPAVSIPRPVPGRLLEPASAPASSSRFEQVGVSLSLLVLTLSTTVSTGAVLMWNFRNGDPPFAMNAGFFPLAWIVRHPDRLSGGWSFSLTLLGILAAHELGHYLACRAHAVRSSLPWILPAPTLIGTFGAFIHLRSRVPSRRALLDIGVLGPLAGIVVTIPVLIAGLLLSRPLDSQTLHHARSISVSTPLALSLVHFVVRQFDPSLPPLDASLNAHPVLVAGWIGLFLTSINLMPAGQLDGGHILYAMSPRAHRWCTNAFVFLLFFAGTMYWVGWLVWGCFLLPSLRHPPVPATPALSPVRRRLGWVGLLLFTLTFTLQPFAGGSLMSFLH